MSLSAALHATVGTLRRRAGDLLPAYALSAAVPGIARVATFLGLGAVLLYLQAAGILGPLVSALASRNLTPPDPEAEPQAFAAWFESLRPALEPVISPVVLGTIAVALLVTIVAAMVLAAAFSAAQLAACDACLRDRRGTVAAIGGVRDHWASFLGAFVLEALLWTIVLVGAIVTATVATALIPILGVLVGIVALLVSLVVLVPTRAVFAFVPAAIVVDDAGLFGAIRSSAGYLRRDPAGAVGYYVISLGVLLAFSSVAAVLVLVEASSVLTPVALLAVAPGLDLLKTGLYAQHRGTVSPPSGPVGTIRGQLSSGLRRGLRRMASFVRRAPLLNAVAVGLLVGGFVIGWLGATPFVGAIQTSIVERLVDHVPPAAALNYFGNNFGVALSMAYSGLALSVPAALTLWFNGVLLGAYARLEVAPAVLAAFITPHGLFELPALVIAGAVGLRLGGAWWRTWRGRASRTALADAMEDAFWVLVGVGVLLAIAGTIEGLVSPYYWRLFL